jgi:hypothetical protein
MSEPRGVPAGFEIPPLATARGIGALQRGHGASMTRSLRPKYRPENEVNPAVSGRHPEIIVAPARTGDYSSLTEARADL